MILFVSVFAVARQAKFMKQRVGMEDDEDDEEEEEKKSAVWGKGKKIYYGADNVDYEVRTINAGESVDLKAKVNMQFF